jgi:hypothetical protein
MPLFAGLYAVFGVGRRRLGNPGLLWGEFVLTQDWRAWQDSNLQPSDPKSAK